MAKKPRRIEDILGEDVIIDNGEYGPDVPAAPRKSPGRPREWPGLDVLAEFYVVNKKGLNLTDEAFGNFVKAYYKKKRNKAPPDKTIRNYIERARHLK
jgi:hypothetical protein